MTSLSKNKFFYRLSFVSVIIDILILIGSIFVVLQFFPLKTPDPYEKYIIPALIYLSVWFVMSYVLKRYVPLKTQKYLKSCFKLTYVTLMVFLILSTVSYLCYNLYYSILVIFTFTTTLLVVNLLFYSLYFAVLYAVTYDEEDFEPEKRLNAQLKPATRLDDDSLKELQTAIEIHSGIKILDMLAEKYDLQSGNTYVNFSVNQLDLKSKQNYKYDPIIQLEKLNNIRGINETFRIANRKLPEAGELVCCFESKSTRKGRFLSKYPQGLNYVFYTIDYIFKRVLPKLYLTKRLYYDITKGKSRILSKTEVYGRLYYCGFEVIDEKKAGDLNFVFARRKKQPDPVERKDYGPMIRLHRMGKNGKVFDVYKMRTMHPYSEYLQAYIYNKNQLQEGGKFNHDIRVTSVGRFMRKYWLDELPMLFNLLRGEMKLVGVRPLSAHYFGLYHKQLQEKRIKFKPGLLPPFYAHMPKTLEEIQDSEMKYLTECENKGVFKTDFKYFFLILKNIFIKKARSA